MTPREELLAAAQAIRKRGWWQRVPRGRAVCMMTASPADYSEHAYNALLEVTGGTTVARFNDEHCATARDAIAALEIAADLAA